MWFAQLLVFFLALVSIKGVFANVPPMNVLEQNVFHYIGQSSAQHQQVMVLGGYRLYRPGVGQFLKQDGYSPFRGNRTLNGFNYAAGNPVLLVDVTGHMFSGSETVPLLDKAEFAEEEIPAEVASILTDEVIESVLSKVDEQEETARVSVSGTERESRVVSTLHPHDAMSREALIRENRQLKYFIEQLAGENRGLRAENNQLELENQELKEQVAEMDQGLGQLQTSIITRVRHLDELFDPSRTSTNWNISPTRDDTGD